MSRFAIIAALLAAPAGAATVMDPDAPRFGDGLRVLGFREEVKVVRLDEYADIDPEPLYLAQTPDREAVFREGEDLCMAKGKLGHFVACNRELAREIYPSWAEPVQGNGITIWPRQAYVTPPPGSTAPPLPWLPVVVPWWPSQPPPVSDVPPPAPIPLPGAGWLLLAALMVLPLWRALGRLGDWFSAERGTAHNQNGWV